MGSYAGVVARAALGALALVTGLLLAAWRPLGLAQPGELRRMPYEDTIVIASARVISEMMLNIGTASHLGTAPLGVAAGPGALAAVLLLTWLLTELMRYKAAAALLFPVA
jgi:hypothetical protein